MAPRSQVTALLIKQKWQGESATLGSLCNHLRFGYLLGVLESKTVISITGALIFDIFGSLGKFFLSLQFHPPITPPSLFLSLASQMLHFFNPPTKISSRSKEPGKQTGRHNSGDNTDTSF